MTSENGSNWNTAGAVMCDDAKGLLYEGGCTQNELLTTCALVTEPQTMDTFYYFLPSVIKNWVTTPDTEEQEEVTSGVTEEGEVASGATEDGEVASGATEDGEVASGVTEDGEVASGVTEEGEVASGATEEEEVASGVTEDGEVASGVTEEGEVSSGATEEGEVASGAREDKEVSSGATEAEDQMQEADLFQKRKERQEAAEILGRHLFYWKGFRSPENIQLLSEDLEFADATVKAYVSHFWLLTYLDVDFRRFLRLFWPEDEPELQHLLVKHFTRQYLTCTEQSLKLQPALDSLCWSMIILNADLNGGHKGRKMTREEFIANLSSATNFQLDLPLMREIYESIKTQPLTAFTVRTRCQAENPEDSGSNSSFGTENNPTTTVHKKGNLIRKRVMDENGRKTKRGQRAWKPFTAVLKGMVLHLQQDTDNKHAIRLHHALAYPIDYKKRPHALCLRTTDARLFYFQAESEVEQASWVAIINRIAARYSAPPLTSASHDINAYCPQLLPSYPTTQTLEQQLESHKDQLKRVSVHEVQELQRYVTYVRALQELVAEKASATRRKG